MSSSITCGTCTCRRATSYSTTLPRTTTTTTRMVFGMNFSSSAKQKQKRMVAKEELLSSLQGLGRGVKASEQDKTRIDILATRLEKMNPTKNVLGPELSARWKLEYTTSGSILGTSRPAFLRPNGTIYQTIRAEKLEARNQETWPFFSAVEAVLEPVNASKVVVVFKTFYIGSIIPIKAPESARGELTVTYLDDDLRISRGNKGNLFILSR